jgi:hypothetical protein
VHSEKSKRKNSFPFYLAGGLSISGAAVNLSGVAKVFLLAMVSRLIPRNKGKGSGQR